MVMTSLCMDHVTLQYGDKPVLKNLDLTLVPGAVVGVVGPNGVGKSTMINALSGALLPTAGTITLNGVNLKDLSPGERAREIAVVPQAARLPAAFTAMEVVLMGRTPYLGWLGREDEFDREIARSALERTSTGQLADRRMGEMSGGEQQRVLIARALAQSPSILLLDEPTAHLDLRHQDEVLNLVRSLALGEGLAVFISLHDLNLVARFTDRIALLSNGRIHQFGKPEDVLQPDILAGVYGLKILVTTHPVHGTPLVLS